MKLRNTYAAGQGRRCNCRLPALLLVILLALTVSGCAPDPEPDGRQEQQSPQAEASQATANIRVKWAADVQEELTKYDEFEVEDTEAAEGVVFFTDQEISDFKILSLSLEEVDEDGNITFSGRTVYKQKELTPDCPLLVTAPFYGSIPNWGIAYTDTDGNKRTMSVSVSGKDGSVLLTDIEII